MRNFDNWNRYLDNDNQPLHGCVMFNVKDGNTVAPIYDSDGTDLDNPILTDEYGRTQHQVFVDVDVIAYFYKYIGNGNFQSLRNQDIDLSDDSLWSLQFTAENINDILAHITGDSAMCVGTISDLRNLNVDDVPVVCGNKVITLLGYNEVGDKEPINYVWVANSTDNDDNGAVIQGTELTGRWIMVKPTEHCDSRHYGIFPQNTTNFTSDTARIEQWIAYCNAVNLRPYFSANGDYKYYKYNNLNFTIPVVDIAKGVTFIDNGSSNIWTTEFNGDPYFMNHNTKLATKEVKTSWGASLFITPKHVIVDDNSLFYNTTLSNCEVDIDVTCDKVCTFTNCKVNLNKALNSVSTFVNCIINSKNNISAGCYFTNCQLTEDMFYGSPYIHVDGNCIADFDDFEHKELMWLRIKDQQAQINYDWKGRLTTQNPWENVVDADRWLINYKGTNVDAVLKESDNAHTYYLENCAGTITLQGKAANTYYFKDCEIIVKFANGYNQGCTISASNSTISISQDRVRLNRFNLQNANLIGTGSVDTDYASIYNSIQNIDVYSGYCDMKDSNVGPDVTIQVYGIDAESSIHVDPQPEVTATHTEYDVTRIIAGNFVNNFVNGTIEIGTIDVSDPHITTIDLVRGLTIKDNIGLGATPIKVNRSLSSMYDNYNIYTYQGNTGTMAMTVERAAAIESGTWTPGANNTLTIGMNNTTLLGYTNPDDNSGYVFLAKFFTIGTNNVSVNVRTDVVCDNGLYTNVIAGATSRLLSYNISNPNIKYNGNITNQFEWKIRCINVGQGVLNTQSSCIVTITQI